MLNAAKEIAALKCSFMGNRGVFQDQDGLEMLSHRLDADVTPVSAVVLDWGEGCPAAEGAPLAGEERKVSSFRRGRFLQPVFITGNAVATFRNNDSKEGGYGWYRTWMTTQTGWRPSRRKMRLYAAHIR